MRLICIHTEVVTVVLQTLVITLFPGYHNFREPG